jgi:hypothetical protein
MAHFYHSRIEWVVYVASKLFSTYLGVIIFFKKNALEVQKRK